MFMVINITLITILPNTHLCVCFKHPHAVRRVLARMGMYATHTSPLRVYPLSGLVVCRVLASVMFIVINITFITILRIVEHRQSP